MEAERIDVRKLEPAVREQLRKSALRMHQRGRLQTAIAAELGAMRSTVSIWIGQARNGGGTKDLQLGRSLGANSARIRPLIP
jgi:hypothetical protein